MIRNRLILILILFASGITYAKEHAKFNIKNGATNFEITHTESGEWTCNVDGNDLVVKRSDNAYELYRWGGRFATGEMNAGKLNLYESGDFALFSLKLSDEKIKLCIGNSIESIEFKIKPDKIKVVEKGAEVGKVKFYADTGKCKAKNAREETVAESNDFETCSVALAPFVVQDIDKEIRLFSVLILLALDQ